MKLILILILSIATHASFWQECEGIVTITKINTIGKERKVDLQVHEHTFKCKGHSSSLYNVVSQNVSLVSITGISPKVHKHYHVSYKYSDGKSLTGVSTSREWGLIKRVNAVPVKPEEDSYSDTIQRPPTTPSEGIDLYADIKAWEKEHKDQR